MIQLSQNPKKHKGAVITPYLGNISQILNYIHQNNKKQKQVEYFYMLQLMKTQIQFTKNFRKKVIDQIYYLVQGLEKNVNKLCTENLQFFSKTINKLYKTKFVESDPYIHKKIYKSIQQMNKDQSKQRQNEQKILKDIAKFTKDYKTKQNYEIPNEYCKTMWEFTKIRYQLELYYKQKYKLDNFRNIISQISNIQKTNLSINQQTMKNLYQKSEQHIEKLYEFAANNPENNMLSSTYSSKKHIAEINFHMLRCSEVKYNLSKLIKKMFNNLHEEHIEKQLSMIEKNYSEMKPNKFSRKSDDIDVEDIILNKTQSQFSPTEKHKKNHGGKDLISIFINTGEGRHSRSKIKQQPKQTTTQSLKRINQLKIQLTKVLIQQKQINNSIKEIQTKLTLKKEQLGKLKQQKNKINEEIKQIRGQYIPLKNQIESFCTTFNNMQLKEMLLKELYGNDDYKVFMDYQLIFTYIRNSKWLIKITLKELFK